MQRVRAATDDDRLASRLDKVDRRVQELQSQVRGLQRLAVDFRKWTTDHITDHYNHDKKGRTEMETLSDRLTILLQCFDDAPHVPPCGKFRRLQGPKLSGPIDLDP